MNDLFSFLIACLVIEATPGPNMAYLAVLSVDKGRKAAFFTVGGIALGLFTVGMAVNLGISGVLMESKTAYALLRWGGVFYLLWLAGECWNTKGKMAVDKGKRSSGRRTFFWRGFIANILNPKAAVFYIAVFPAFIEASGNIFGQTIGLTIIYVTIATAIHCLIVALAGTAHGFFNHPVRFLVARRVMSLLLVAVAFWFAFETKLKFDQPIS